MKKRMVIFLCIVSSAIAAFGQTAPVLVPLPATNIEKQMARKDALMTTESYYLPAVPGDSCNIRLQALIVYEPGRESQQLRGLKILVSHGTDRTKEQPPTVSFIDFEELPLLSRAIGAMLDLTQKGASLPNPVSKEMSFATVGGLTFTMVQRETERQLTLINANQPDNVCTLSRSGSIQDLKTSIDGVWQGR
jgi:hypothetical protein